MADGFTLEIDADLADLIARKTAKTGMTREDAARRAAAGIYDAIDQLTEFPELGRLKGEIRQLVVKFGEAGFLVSYRLEGGIAVIEGVIHGRQDRQRD